MLPFVPHVESLVHVYCGSAVRGDGNSKIALHICAITKDPETGAWQASRPYSVVLAWVGGDFPLLKPVVLAHAED